jgi:toxin ParE1/3/4
MAPRRLRLTPQAEADLIAIWTYIARANPDAADRLLDRLEQKSALLVQYPHLGMARDDIRPGVRHFPVGNYLILYRIAGDGIEVARYVHGRRRLQDMV